MSDTLDSTTEAPDIEGPGMPTLPPDWEAITLAHQFQDADKPWGDAAQNMLKAGPMSLAIDMVERAVLRATGLLSPNRPFWSERWLAGIPSEHDPIQSAWADYRVRKNSRGRVISAIFEKQEAFLNELEVLSAFHSNKYETLSRAGRSSGSDWGLRKNGLEFSVEVKLRMHTGRMLDLMNRVFTTAMLLPGNAGLYSVAWHLDGEDSEKWTMRLKRPELDAYMSAFWANSGGLAKWLKSSPEDGSEWQSPDTAMQVERYGHQVIARLKPTPESKPFYFEGTYQPDGGPFYYTQRSHAAYIPSDLEEGQLIREGQACGGKIIDQLEKQAKRGATTAQPEVLYVVVWQMPHEWDEAFALHPEYMRQVLGAATEKANDSLPGAAIGIWPKAFSRVGDRVYFNEPAASLLGCRSLRDARHPPPRVEPAPWDLPS